MRLPSGKDVYSSTPVYPGSQVTKNCTRPIEDLWIDGKLIIADLDIEINIIATAENMDFYRQKLGAKPITVTSWYRPAHVNSMVKGSKWSRHQYGDGVDFVASHLTSRQIATKLEPFHDNGGYCCYPKFTHIDWRGRKARW